jgi:hypothetical protein
MVDADSILQSGYQELECFYIQVFACNDSECMLYSSISCHSKIIYITCRYL